MKCNIYDLDSHRLHPICTCVYVLKGQAGSVEMKERKSCRIEKQAAQRSIALPSYKLKSVSQAAKKQLRLACSAQKHFVGVTNPFVALFQPCWEHFQVICGNLWKKLWSLISVYRGVFFLDGMHHGLFIANQQSVYVQWPRWLHTYFYLSHVMTTEVTSWHNSQVQWRCTGSWSRCYQIINKGEREIKNKT